MKIFAFAILLVATINWPNFIPFPSPEEDYRLEPIAMLDTCKSTAILEPMVDQVYDSMVYKWYFEDNIINETAPLIQVQDPGKYTVEISGILNGYVQVTQQTFVVPEVLEIEEVIIDHASCEKNNGSFQVKVNYEAGVLYSINGGNFQPENVFENLAPGNYTVTIQNSFNCFDNQSIVIEQSSLPIIKIIESSPSTCGEKNGRIVYETSGGTGRITTSINTDTLQSDNTFQNLTQGEYTITAVDEAGCTAVSTINVAGTECPIYIPNVFSPNGDGVNDLFQIEAKTGFNARILTYSIFNRWGNQLYEAHNFGIDSSDQWWDGTFKNRIVNAGSYLYLMEVELDNGEIEIFRGAINILY